MFDKVVNTPDSFGLYLCNINIKDTIAVFVDVTKLLSPWTLNKHLPGRIQTSITKIR